MGRGIAEQLSTEKWSLRERISKRGVNFFDENADSADFGLTPF